MSTSNKLILHLFSVVEWAVNGTLQTGIAGWCWLLATTLHCSALVFLREEANKGQLILKRWRHFEELRGAKLVL